MTFDPSTDYDEDKVIMREEAEHEGFEVLAYCSPDAMNMSFHRDGTPVDREILPLDEYHGAPFGMDVVYLGDAPFDREVFDEVRESLAEEFEECFAEAVQEVWESIENSDDPLGKIMEASTEGITLEEDDA